VNRKLDFKAQSRSEVTLRARFKKFERDSKSPRLAEQTDSN